MTYPFFLYKFVKKKALKTYFRQYKPFFIFLTRFFLVYVVLTVAYQTFLNRAAKNEADEITQSVAAQTEQLLTLINYNALVRQHRSQPSMMLMLEDVYVARVVEGCNAVSVIILFAAFVVAFKGRFAATVLYIIGGCVIIHTLNVIRIALLSIALLKYPEHEHLLHGVLFPLFIYGVVFGLWVVWVNKFSLHASKTA